MTNPPHVFRDSDITEETILVPSRMINMAKPGPGKMDFKVLENKLLKKMTIEELKTDYLGWFLVPTHVYPRAFLQWTDGVSTTDVKYEMYQPMQVKLAARFYKPLPVDVAEVCKDLFESLKHIRWHRNGTSNPKCISIAVVRDGKKYVAPRYTLAQLTRAVKKKAPRKRKKPAAAPATKKGTQQKQPKKKRSKRNASSAVTTTGNEAAFRELQQTQATLDESIFQRPANGKEKKKRKKKKKRSRSSKKKQKNLAKKQRKNVPVAVAPPTKDRWGYLNPQMYTHWKKASFSMNDTLAWTARIFKKHKKPVIVMPEAGKPCAAKFTHFPSPENMVLKGKLAHSMKNPLNFTEHHRWIAEIADLRWAKESETPPPPQKSSGIGSSSPIEIPAVATPLPVATQKDPSFFRSALVRKSAPPISLSAATPHEEMEILDFAFHQNSNGGGGGGGNLGCNIISSRTFSAHMLLYANEADQDTNVVSKYRIKHVENQGMFRVLAMTREWLIQHQLWNKVLQYDPWCGIEDGIKNLRFDVDGTEQDNDGKAAGKLFSCFSNHLACSDPVDLYYEFHDKVLKQLVNAMADKGDSAKGWVDRARTIFNSLCKIQNPTRDLAASSRGFQGERLKVLWILVHSMIVLKGQTQNVDLGSTWQELAFQKMETPNEDSMCSTDIDCSSSSSTGTDQDHNEWHRNRFTSAAVRIWDGMRHHETFFSGIQKMSQERGFKKIKTISDFMGYVGSLGRGRFRFYILNTFNHLFPYGCPEARLDNSVVPAAQLQKENQQFQHLTQELTKAFGLNSKAYLGV